MKTFLCDYQIFSPEQFAKSSTDHLEKKKKKQVYWRALRCAERTDKGRAASLRSSGATDDSNGSGGAWKPFRCSTPVISVIVKRCGPWCRSIWCCRALTAATDAKLVWKHFVCLNVTRFSFFFLSFQFHFGGSLGFDRWSLLCPKERDEFYSSPPRFILKCFSSHHLSLSSWLARSWSHV